MREEGRGREQRSQLIAEESRETDGRFGESVAKRIPGRSIPTDAIIDKRMLEGVQIDGYKYADSRKFEREERDRESKRGGIKMVEWRESSMSNGKVQVENVAGCYVCIKFFTGDIVP